VGQAAESGQQGACQIDRAVAADADAQEDRQQLRVRKCGRAACQQLLARTLVRRPVGDRHDVSGSSRAPRFYCNGMVCRL